MSRLALRTRFVSIGDGPKYAAMYEVEGAGRSRTPQFEAGEGLRAVRGRREEFYTDSVEAAVGIAFAGLMWRAAVARPRRVRIQEHCENRKRRGDRIVIWRLIGGTA